ncbi:hypothetical protein A9239_02860 [Methanosarcina sp. A14]|uniref:Uncharacterized protein n=1 Tax=Methanosarcina barkeri CM1 TaxID=796385 RepID=A0A0G3CKB0_METBA|nr:MULTISPECIES: hypothetical protein [Methanosarcina]AKJ40348.1 hypothetical protein MCM1_3361 [Methanosarcina barkeri CM1]OEC91502.1 hypothetical protein A9239_02860 [Methanosarcina sp. A14]
MIGVNRGVENVKKDVIYYIGNPAFLSATKATAAENVGKAKISSNYAVVLSPDTEIRIVDKDTG